MSKGTTGAIAGSGLVLATILIVLGSMEGASRLLDLFWPLPARSWQEYRLRIPPPYQGAPYDVAQLVREDLEIKWQTSPDFGWLPEDQSGRYINFHEHRRVTTGSPSSNAPHIWMFGGSTVAGAEVPDGLTVASMLQNDVNSHGFNFKVENLGATTISIGHQLFRLKNMTAVEPGDVVIFYDGVNDIIQSLYYKNPHGTMIDDNRKVLKELPFTQRFIWSIYSRFSGYSAFVRRFLSPIRPVYYDVDLPKETLDRLEADYFASIASANEVSRLHSATFFHFLQPNIYTLSHLTGYERSVVENGWLYPTNLKAVYAVGYPALRRSTQRAVDIGVAAKDLSDVFDRRQREIFLDYCHVNEHGNELVAKAIYDVISPALVRLSR